MKQVKQDWPYCEYESIHTSQRVKNHFETMHKRSERGYKCSEDHCSESFATKWDRSWHLNGHYAYKCQHCGHAYKTSAGLINHELNRIENENECLNNPNRVKPRRKAIPKPEIHVAVETTQKHLGQPHWLYIRSLLDFADFGLEFEDNFRMKKLLFILEELNESEPNLFSLRSFYVFISTLNLVSIYFVSYFREPYDI